MPSYYLNQRWSKRPSDNGSTRYWSPGSLCTLGAGGCTKQRNWLFMWINILCIEYILLRILTIKSMFDFVIMLKRLTVKDMPINNCDLLNIQACSFDVFWNTPSTQSLVGSCKCWVVPMISTRVSGHCQGILFTDAYVSPGLSEVMDQNILALDHFWSPPSICHGNMNNSQNSPCNVLELVDFYSSCLCIT